MCFSDYSGLLGCLLTECHFTDEYGAKVESRLDAWVYSFSV